MKKWVYLISIFALGFVIFNNVISTIERIKINSYYLIGFAISMIASILYGILNTRNKNGKKEK